MRPIVLVRSLTIALLALLAGGWASAPQEDRSDDWTLTHLPAGAGLAAGAMFDNGITLLVRCQNDVLDLMIGGLPEATGRTGMREIGLATGADEPRMTTWTVGTQRSVAFSRLPALVARNLAEGGDLQIVVPSEGRRMRYVMSLDPSSTAVEQVLTACGRPLVDPRDNRLHGNGQDGLPTPFEWARTPRIEFPHPVGDRSPRTGYVTMTCVVVAQGRLDECQIEAEHPAGYNLARAVLRGLRSGRVRLNEEGRAGGHVMEGHMVAFSINFVLQG